jgi:uncharacterized protein YbaR (Trm112 family)
MRDDDLDILACPTSNVKTVLDFSNDLHEQLIARRLHRYDADLGVCLTCEATALRLREQDMPHGFTRSIERDEAHASG